LALLENKTVLLTGAAGTVGRELIKHILKQEPKELRVIDNNESEIFNLEEEYGHSYRGYSVGDSPTASMFHAYIGDIRDPDKLRRKMTGVDIVFHVAALKHVVLCERSPFDAVQTNINGVKNIIDCALEHNVERVIFTSSDKAVNPTSVMGTSKLMGERLISAANSMKGNKRTIFSSTRFGNVIGSRGSVVPIFYRQIKEGGPITLTDSNMTRFIMTIEESARLVLQAAALAKGGEVFVTKMEVIRIKDLADAMIEMISGESNSIEIKEIGPKPGEKLYEELMTDEETGRALELEEMFSVLPAFRHVYEDIDYSYPNVLSENVDDPYISANSTALNKDQIKSYLIEHKILEKITEGEK
jgi:FlaA1/EpsC-like NDP-sugar epimerase